MTEEVPLVTSLLTAQDTMLDRTSVSLSLSLLPTSATTHRGDLTTDR